MTSKYINQHKLLDHIYSSSLSDDNITLAEYLVKNGYNAAAFTANTLVNTETGILQGFEDINILEDEEKMTNMVLSWLQSLNSKKSKQKFFLWVHYFDPHAPYTARMPYFEKYNDSYKGTYGDEISFDEVDKIFLNKTQLSKEDIKHMNALYDSQISRIDSYIRKIIDELKRLKIYDQAILVFFADHGEELYERNFYIEHYRSVYDSALRIPLIIRYPGKVPSGKRYKDITESIDIMPTVLDLCKITPEETLSGLSLLPLFRGEKHKEFGVSEWWDLIFTLRTDDWAYIWNPTGRWPTDSRFEGGEYPVDKEELYNLKADPHEKNNLVNSKGEMAAAFNKKIKEWIKSNIKKNPESKSIKNFEKPKISKEQEERLRSLGYIN